MKKIKINDKEFELIEEYKEGFDEEELNNRYTDYFDSYDYVLGDWAYGKLRLKGFNDKDNKNFNEINDFKNKEKYIKENCAFDCKYFVLKRLK